MRAHRSAPWRCSRRSAVLPVSVPVAFAGVTLVPPVLAVAVPRLAVAVLAVITVVFVFVVLRGALHVDRRRVPAAERRDVTGAAGSRLERLERRGCVLVLLAVLGACEV